MRDLDRWKDKVEISLDGRQIFFLFFGSAVAACLIFVVGVLIGKRIEARALAMTPAPIEDPLAALDQLGDADEADEGLTFHKALTPDKSGKREHDKRDVDESRGSDEARVEPGKPEALASKLEARETAAGKGEARETAASKLEAREAAGKAERDGGKPEARESGKPDAREAQAKKPLPPAPHAAPIPPARAQVVAAAPAGKKPDGAKKPDANAPPHFTLQLSAFPDKSDAEEFMRKIQAAGYKPFLVASEIPGKGVFFRVRVGDFASRQAAVDAKTEFERKQRIIAYVAKL
jgi:DedD protein